MTVRPQAGKTERERKRQPGGGVGEDGESGALGRT
jgi:hypothetical protein